GLGLQDYHVLARRLQDETARLNELRTGLEQEMAQAEGWQRELLALEQALATLNEAVRAQEALLANANQRITADRTTLGHEAEQPAKVEADLERTRGQVAEATVRVAALSAEAGEAGRQAREAEARTAEGKAGVAALGAALAATVARLAELDQRLKEDRES